VLDAGLIDVRHANVDLEWHAGVAELERDHRRRIADRERPLRRNDDVAELDRDGCELGPRARAAP
jgi:hypothetical protein